MKNETKITVEMSIEDFNNFQEFMKIKESGIIVNTIYGEAVWRTWGGWKGNHDQRIEGAKCSNCGWLHPTVYGSLTLLSEFCGKCGAMIRKVEYEDGTQELI